ncbi:transcriptional regulator [Stackebrandtia endophytica]|uniref:Transcriptional regulator n=1 Tax=Stackebrandtia endophytica TaxID=1496996 RepID=A0A543ASY0_9ACTN|nr:transcriptional regulator [Stackebrandtia endophytica]TQL75605.1 transcriptional regulator [Stackebrandtia endophytica]
MAGQLDPIIHPTHRLKICAMLVAGTTVEMAVVKDALGLSASALSKQVTTLTDAGYVTQDRSKTDSRRVWLSLSREGLRAYRDHVAALQEIVAGATPAGDDSRPKHGQAVHPQ